MWSLSHMIRPLVCNFKTTHHAFLLIQRARCHTSKLVISEEVKHAVHTGEPVVALESTILTHGMPYPDNLQMALNVEAIVRSHGCIPATIALMDGKALVGLTSQQLQKLSEPNTNTVKVSRRDIAHTLNTRIVGGTTISATMVLAHKSGIKTFVSGGLGGVHRDGESSLDISTDLTELGRTPVAVITSGVKSILDIGRTLEFLETQGVCVATYGNTTDFPAFFTRQSGYLSSCCVSNFDEAASLISTTFDLGLRNGVLIAVPIPEEHNADGELIENAVKQAIEEANTYNVKGKDITPYILKRVNQLTEGLSLKANIALVENNAHVGAQIAARLSKLDSRAQELGCKSQKITPKAEQVLSGDACHAGSQPVVVGACNTDFIYHILEDTIKFDGPTNLARTTTVCGGVGRNICDALTCLGWSPKLLTSVGKDLNGERLMKESKHLDWSLAKIAENQSSGTYAVILNKTGDPFLGIGDMSVHDSIDPDYIMAQKEQLKRASIVIMDGNISVSSMRVVGQLSQQFNRAVFFEPTDTQKAIKPFKTGIGNFLTFAKPNLKELEAILNYVTGKSIDTTNKAADGFLEYLANSCEILLEHIPSLIVTLGEQGLIFCTSQRNQFYLKDEVSSQLSVLKNTPHVLSLHVKSFPLENVKSLSGAGDCLSSAFIHGYLKGWNIERSLLLGVKAASMSAQHYVTVPNNIGYILE